MRRNGEEQDALNREHAKNPKVGDYWQEMLSPVAVVISVTPFYVLTIEKRISDAEGWMWDFEAKPNVYSRKEFVWRFTYGRIMNDKFEGTEDPKNLQSNKYWCDVRPEAHKWVEEELQEMA